MFFQPGDTAYYKDRGIAVIANAPLPVPDPSDNEKKIDIRMDAIVAAQPLTSEPTTASGCG
jgi:hypothetical protein